MTRFKLGRTRQSHDARDWLLAAVRQGAEGLVNQAAARFDLSRQAINRHLAWLVDNDYLIADGATPSRTYRLGARRIFQSTYNIECIDGHGVHQHDFGFIFQGLPDNVAEICDYGFSEMLNNAIDHSGGVTVLIAVERTAAAVNILMHDDGEGIFRRVARRLGLHDPCESLRRLAKGRVTTDPERHVGEGIFFAARAFDAFSIASGDLEFAYRDDREPVSLLPADIPSRGTLVNMAIATDSRHDVGKLFEA
jgi:anti-sigma regulatory factor (Ser/Thr protein kinase)